MLKKRIIIFIISFLLIFSLVPIFNSTGENKNSPVDFYSEQTNIKQETDYVEEENFEELNIEKKSLNTKIKSERTVKDISNNYNFLEQIREQALSKLKYENMDMDSLIYEFLKRIEIYHTDEEDTIKLKIILNTGNDFGINFKHNKHHFSTNHSYD